MREEVTIAGFGGQGILFAGRVLAYAALLDKKHTTWLPSYGPEMRGGTANCSVIISSLEIESPLVLEPTSALLMNRPSLDKFEHAIREEGLLIVNSSLVEADSTREDIEVVRIPATELAMNIGDPRVANMIMLGAYVGKRKITSSECLKESLKKTLPKSRQNLLLFNQEALKRGFSLAKNNR